MARWYAYLKYVWSYGACDFELVVIIFYVSIFCSASIPRSGVGLVLVLVLILWQILVRVLRLVLVLVLVLGRLSICLCLWHAPLYLIPDCSIVAVSPMCPICPILGHGIQSPLLDSFPNQTASGIVSNATQRNETRLSELACISKFQVSLQPRWSAARTSTSTPAANPPTLKPSHPKPCMVTPFLSPFSLPIRPQGGFIALGIFAYLRHHRSSLLCVSQLSDMVEGKTSGRSRKAAKQQLRTKNQQRANPCATHFLHSLSCNVAVVAVPVAVALFYLAF